MSFAEELQKTDSKGILFRSNESFTNYSTTLLPLDYALGYWTTVKEEDGSITHQAVPGINGGYFLSIISFTGLGKSTLAAQIGYSIINQFEHGYMEIIDCEKTFMIDRLKKLNGITENDPRVVVNKDHTTIEDVLTIINTIAKVRQDGKDKYMYTTPNRKYNGDAIKAYVPSVVVIDSLPFFNSGNLDLETMGTNMDQARASKDISTFINRVKDTIYKYNITLIVINHIRPAVNTDPYNAPPKGIMMLKPTETLVRGHVMQYMTQNYLRIDTIKSNAYTIDENGFKGYKCSIQLAKAKNNVTGTVINVALNTELGFDPIYTMFEFGDQFGLIQGRNPYLYFDGLEEFKFNRKDFRRKFIEEKPFRDGIMGICKPYLETLLGEKPSTEPVAEGFSIVKEYFGNSNGLSDTKISAAEIEAATSGKKKKK
jgi:RecA/RadA recombinase